MKNVEKFEDAIPRVNGIYYKRECRIVVGNYNGRRYC
jgi:hypothetical protein